ncbi:glycerophosphoryl diester phosphodiesterase [Herbihabitans rhizosphaerae]|uniref:Glycerophosphoryl diester phosphodiesterase n=1 Tax=Herbihabitans rhizosphaerae TaxID=1872711 RepID=A0A4Q7L3C7_9PSEU|nr:glycerophosphodiester phosphodiesterase family protein [Herbihabitans rhizosphaerae]RZS43737.1 glycerophosphoryl diester phosphodiesterase [Herbihabitans rhizosphaerae]
MRLDFAADHGYLRGPHPRAFVHRGWHVDDLDGMENSLSAFRRAVDEGYRYLETDVHATSDGVVVVHHDAALDRTTDATGQIARLPWQTVRRAKVAGREPVSRLEDLLEELPEALVNIDVKADTAVEPVLDAVRRTDAWERVCLGTFSDTRLARVRKLGGARLITSMGPRSVLALWASGWNRRLPVSRAIRGFSAQVPVRHGRLELVTRRTVEAAHRMGLEVHVWTINDPVQMNALLDLGVDGLVTDRPDLLRDVLTQRGTWATT